MKGGAGGAVVKTSTYHRPFLRSMLLVFGSSSMGESILMAFYVYLGPGRGRYLVSNADTEGGVAVWQVADGGEQ